MLETPEGAAGRGPVDLHLHSTCSDGRLEPEEVVEAAANAGLARIALTDHDTVEGLERAAGAAARRSVDLVAGCEISAALPLGGERHLLAYGFDPAHAELEALLAENRAARDERLGRMIDALAAEGAPVTREACLAAAGGSSVGRPHVADALVAAGHVRSRREAFDRFLADHRAAAVAKRNVPAARVIETVHRAGGACVLAHPGHHGDPSGVDQLVRLGLDGIEAIHPAHSAGDERKARAAARRHGLVVTGGSDNHGDRDGMEAMRACRVGAEVGRALDERLAVRRGRRPTAAPEGSCA